MQRPTCACYLSLIGCLDYRRQQYMELYAPLSSKYQLNFCIFSKIYRIAYPIKRNMHRNRRGNDNWFRMKAREREAQKAESWMPTNRKSCSGNLHDSWKVRGGGTRGDLARLSATRRWVRPLAEERPESLLVQSSPGGSRRWPLTAMESPC